MIVPLFSRDLGGAGRPPLVILHGMLGASRNWQMAGAELSSHFHVRALDLRNHGASGHADEMTYEAMADDVLAWLDSQALERTALLGHSMGGKVAMVIACRYPERVERLILVDIAPKDYASGRHREEFAAMNELELGRLRTRAEAEAYFESRVPDRGLRKFLVSNLERLPQGGWRWQIDLPAITAALGILEKNPLRPEDRYDGPTLVIAGGKSNYIQPADWPKILEYFPNARLNVIAESAHNPHMEARAAFVRAVTESLSPAASTTSEATPEGNPREPPTR